MLNELGKEKNEKTQSPRFFAQKFQGEIKAIDEKLKKLMNSYLENALNLAEYRKDKNKLVNQKQLLKDKLNAFGQKSNNRFELAAKFINSVKQAEIIALQENPVLGRDFLKKIGSNFRIAERTLSFPLKNAWILAGKYHAEAQRDEATSYDFSESTNWRRGWDSNPRGISRRHGFRDRFLKPLGHPSLFLGFTSSKKLLSSCFLGAGWAPVVRLSRRTTHSDTASNKVQL